ncbi:MAG: amidohydrolase family protein [Flavobacteriales bacterium]|nr:amidohydrolase family protein [Flavobacteriales bacterium]
MRLRKILGLVAAFLLSFTGQTQDTFPYNGVRPSDVTSVAFTHATIYQDFKTRIENATLVIEKGRVIACGTDVAIPSNAVVIDLMGKYIYPSFIDLDSEYGMPKSEQSPRQYTGPQYTASRKGAFGWNDAIRADVNAASLFADSEETAKNYRAIGFGLVLTHLHDGIARGTSALVSLHPEENLALINPRVAAYYSFNKGSSRQAYPSSLMGSIALLRQTYYDAQWYAQNGRLSERNLSLQAFNDIQDLPQIFEAGDKWNLLRADKIGDEFNVQYILRGSGNEYQRISEIKNTGAALIVPIELPMAYDVSDPLMARWVSTDEMLHWELAPTNPARLHSAGIEFCLTSSGMSDQSVFLKNLRKVVRSGLPEAEALKALTYTPARLMGEEKAAGSLRTGYWANFLITSGNLFLDETVLYENWVQGEPYILEEKNKSNLAGNYKLEVGLVTYDLEVTGNPGKHKAKIFTYGERKSDDGTVTRDTTTTDVDLQLFGELLTLGFKTPDTGQGVVRLTGDIDPVSHQWKGSGEQPDGRKIQWKAQLVKLNETVSTSGNTLTADSALVALSRAPIPYPFNAYGWTNAPTQETVLITNATVWTCEKDGKIENGQVLISKGKIVAVGKNLSTTGYTNIKTIDAAGKHVTPGIIDEHSHIALESVNEGGQASSAEVEESRVVWPEDINIYRQLAGGVTCSQLLHGSANPIGGQSALIKLKWGGNADDLLVDNAAPFIKFALGENVKQSNWGDLATERFPQTRMGVEQVYYDHFIRAREYGEVWKNYITGLAKKGKKGGVSGGLVNAPRRDLELEALNQILRGERYITCHSYVQSEINMLMHVADSMNFRINTFTHILEGYKVADKMKAHGAGGSSFSDWWAYKMEVKDAIPYNGALMWENGITVAFNSDDAEMARRLNQEAAKAVKYGDVPEEEALKFVTLNPAKLLHIDDRTGSLAPGKDADIVIWSAHPLSIYARAEKTYVDGICYYDLEKETATESSRSAERARLIQKMLEAKSGGEPTASPKAKEKKHFHCDTLDQTSEGIYIH